MERREKSLLGFRDDNVLECVDDVLRLREVFSHTKILAYSPAAVGALRRRVLGRRDRVHE